MFIGWIDKLMNGHSENLWKRDVTTAWKDVKSGFESLAILTHCNFLTQAGSGSSLTCFV